MKTLFLFILCLYFFNVHDQPLIPAVEVQIKTAVLAAPAELQAEATVYGYNKEGKMILLRKGNNDLICLADDPQVSGFNVACYHKDLEPFMKRGRELKMGGKKGKEIEYIRVKEIESGSLKMPTQPTALYVFTASEKDYNKETGEVNNTHLRYVVYTPYATSESTGLPLRPHAPGMPWIMDPGTPHAHIMITPPTNKNDQ
jgi:hypothetical protein